MGAHIAVAFEVEGSVASERRRIADIPDVIRLLMRSRADLGGCQGYTPGKGVGESAKFPISCAT